MFISQRAIKEITFSNESLTISLLYQAAVGKNVKCLWSIPANTRDEYLEDKGFTERAALKNYLKKHQKHNFIAKF